MSLIQLNQQFLTRDLIADADLIYEQAIDALTNLKEGQCKGAELTGWYGYPRARGFEEAASIRSFVDQLNIEYDLVLVVGIGGSYLGTRAIADALSHRYAGQIVGRRERYKPIQYCGHHLDDGQLIELLEYLDTRLPIVNVISKSGQSTEPAVAFRIIRSYMEARFGKEEAKNRTIVTTDATKGALRTYADEQHIKSFVVPDDIGGRYSVLTPVGLVPLALAGFDIKALLEGASEVFEELDEVYAKNSDKHAALDYATSRIAAYQAGKRIELLSYSAPKLRNLTEWWKQLFGESEGKKGKGLFPMGMAYTTDLHSLGQMVQSGERHLLETFLLFDHQTQTNASLAQHLKVPAASGSQSLDNLGYLEGRKISDINHAAIRGTKVAHYDGGVPCLEITVKGKDEFSFGALMAFFKISCAISGQLLGVNPFDQPGVEMYKNNLFALLGKPGFEDLGKEIRQRL